MPAELNHVTILNMFGTMELQIQYLLLLQHFREITHGIFDGFFMAATWFGEIIIPLTFLSIVYWGINKKAGRFIFFNFGLTLYVNVFLKMTACIKRPWLIDSRVCPIEKALPAADGYSFPSGHTAGAMSSWGAAAYWWWKNKAIRYTMIAIVLLVAFSRNYIGVHTPQDVIVSIAVGIVLMFFVDKLLNWIDKKPNRDIIFYFALLALTTILYIYLHLKCCVQMETYDSLKDLVNPLEMKHGVYSKIGFMLGVFTGWILEKRFINFQIPQKTTQKRVCLIAAGIVILYVLMMFLNKIFILFIAKHLAAAIIAFLTAFYITCAYPAILKISERF